MALPIGDDAPWTEGTRRMILRVLTRIANRWIPAELEKSIAVAQQQAVKRWARLRKLHAE